MELARYDNRGFRRGRSRLTEFIWIVLQALFVRSWVPGSMHRVLLLRMFGARIGRGVVVKPGVQVKFPWRLEIGNNSWIGEQVWIDNLDRVVIGQNCCISQGAYMCTGSHDLNSNRFDLITQPIIIEDQSWICAKASVKCGVRVHEGAVLSLGSVALRDLAAGCVYEGNPARRREEPGSSADIRKKAS